MSSQALIDSIVQQTTVLIAHLATRAGGRTPVAQIANRVFIDLTNELREQGVAKSVIADMFGMALRTYHRRVRALQQSQTVRERSVWEAVLEYVRAQEPCAGADVHAHFVREDPELLTGVLRDLSHSGLLYSSGRGNAALYRAADPKDFEQADPTTRARAAESLVWVQVYRRGPIGLEALIQLCHMDEATVVAALATLQLDGRVVAVEEGGAVRYHSPRFDVPVGDREGWEGAVLDHYQALVSALCTKLRSGDTVSLGADVVGGATYTFDVGPDHPLQDEARGMLAAIRAQVIDLRDRVDAHNALHGLPEALEPVTFPSAEVCNLLDDDCDGQYDEMVSPVDDPRLGKPCGLEVGECSPGTWTCKPNYGIYCGGRVAPTTEVCDGLDNDCDGSVDEDLDNLGPCGTSVGACLLGRVACVGGAVQCTGFVGPKLETCPGGFDEDCDGIIDEDECGAETCNGLDDDGDVAVDEGIHRRCGVDMGECTSAVQQCVDGQWTSCQDVGPVAEACNGLDDDCDGKTDEDNPDGGAACGSDVGECTPGFLFCAPGPALVCVGQQLGGPERCDDVDNDCDGIVDEMLARSCGVDFGECESGQESCNGGVWEDCTALGPSPEQCNELDDDCDGLIDESCM